MDDVNTTSLEPRLVLLQVSFFFVSFFFLATYGTRIGPDANRLGRCLIPDVFFLIGFHFYWLIFHFFC